jgi:hypothetical protein
VPQTSYVTNFRNAKVEASGFETSRVQNPYINIHEPPKGEKKVGLSFPV